jgi:hypothetical protein
MLVLSAEGLLRPVGDFAEANQGFEAFMLHRNTTTLLTRY